jgi:CRISPR/Cas system CSM-associated protein Csm3 (group 7 of RAMP superfamily)
MTTTNKPVGMSITLVFETPPSIAAAGAFGSIADRVVERDALGRFIIPGSHVKGKLRHASEQLLKSVGKNVCDSPRAATMCPNPPGGVPPCVACRIFGSPAYPSSLRFYDLVQDVGSEEAIPEIVAPSLRAMIGVNRRRATVAEGRLFLVETAPYFSELRFSSNEAVSGSLDSEASLRLLLAALKLVPAWGGMKSRGLGWTARLEVSATFDGKPVQGTDWRGLKDSWTDSR